MRGCFGGGVKAGACFLCGIVLAVIFGCSSQDLKKTMVLHNELAPNVSARLWPALPEIPRYRYVGDLLGEQNFLLKSQVAPEDSGADRNWLTAVWHWITGVDEAAREPVVLQRPQSGVTDPEGRIYVTDVSRQAVFVFDPVAGNLSLWEFADERRRFVSPVGITFDHLKRLLITDAELGGVFRFKMDGSFEGSFGAGILRRPTGIAFDSLLRHIYVADTEANDIKVFDSEGSLLDTVGFTGDSTGRLNRPVYLTFAEGHLFVSDALNARIQVFDRDGNATSEIGKRGLFVGNLTRPKGVAVDNEGHIYVVESFYDHLLVFEGDGQLLLAIGGTGQRPGQFYLPAGVWTDTGNRIYVADMFNGRVSIFQFLGAQQ